MDTAYSTANSGEKTLYQNSTYDLISKIAYLIGVPKRIFENDHEPPKLNIYNELEKEKCARIIRHLCIVRTGILKYFGPIKRKMMTEYLSFLSMPQYIPAQSLQQLNDDDVYFMKKSSTTLFHHIIEINRIISNRINNCKPLFPIWLNWNYVRDLFLMPNGFTDDGAKAALTLYFNNTSDYPYQMYINWVPRHEGNILYNDKKFAMLLYQWNNDQFREYSQVSDASSYVKGSIHEYIEGSSRVVIVVDCENSDPYKLCAALKALTPESTARITRIILFDDVHTASAWRILDNFTRIPVEHMLIERVKQNKSLVDIKLTARACQEHYQNQVDSFIIVSSDSDYWGLISSLPDARFLVMVEHEKCSPSMKHALIESQIFYCYIDDFYSGNSEDIKKGALFREIYQCLDQAVNLNVNDMLTDVLRTTRISMTAAERKQFYDRYIRSMYLSIDPDGNVSIELKR